MSNAKDIVEELLQVRFVGLLHNNNIFLVCRPFNFCDANRIMI